jgi:Ca2+-binding RTX toxin-like protein
VQRCETAASGEDDVANIIIEGTNDANELVGGDDNDNIFGYGGDDRLFGGANNDYLLGHVGFDQLFGAQGNDGLEGGLDADLLDGGEGADTALYWNATAGVIASLAAGLGSGGDAAGDVYVSIERLYGSNFDDLLEGNDGDNTIAGLDGDDVIRGLGGNDSLQGEGGDDAIYGGAGADYISGRGGFDYARYDDSPAGVTVSLAAAFNGGAAEGGDATGDKLLEMEALVGSAFADSLTGDHQANDLQGGGGDDVLTGLQGNDTLDGGNGSDAAIFSGSRSDYLISLDASTGTYTVRDLRTGSTADGVDQVRNVETFVFADGAVATAALFDGYPASIVGDDGDNTPTGTSNDDYLSGLGGNDTLVGFGGQDLLDGGAGDDTLDGGDGIDTAVYALARAGVLVSLAQAGAQSTGGAGVDTLRAIENLIGSDFDDRLTGDDGANVLYGLAGNDTLLGGSGDDILIGGSGRDVLDGGEGFDLVSYETAARPQGLLPIVVINLSDPTDAWGDAVGDSFIGIEGVIGSSFNDFIVGRGDVDETLIGGTGNDIIFGQGSDYAQADQVSEDTLIGGAGNDLLIASAASDTLHGSEGIDSVSYSHGVEDPASGIVVDLSDPSRNTGIAAGDTYDSIENVMGSILDDTIVGNAGDNVLMGSYGDDVLIGGAGADVLNGNWFFPDIDAEVVLEEGFSPDTWVIIYEGMPFEGLDGLDLASYAPASSGIVASLRDSTTNTGDAAGDTYVLIEGLVGSQHDDVLEGDVNGNVLAGGGGDDTLIGGDLDWRSTRDRLDGGDGHDTAIVAGRRDDYRISYDFATQSFILDQPGNSTELHDIEVLQLDDVTISVAHLFAGDAADNALIGTDADDDISGALGNDTLEGLGGDDRIDGYLGLDLASYEHAAAAVHVDLRIAGAQDTGGGGTDTLLLIEGLVGSAFNDALIGTAGDNVLIGGGGDDLLIGFLGANTFDGSAGSDTVSYASVRFGADVDLAIGGPQITHADSFGVVASDTLVGIENLIGSESWGDTLKGDSGANRLMGGGGWDVLMGRGGDDILDGGSATDTASYADAASGVTVDLAIAGPQETGEGADALISIENLTGSEFADTLKGDGGWNHLIGGGGNDILMGRGGSNILDGGAGVDTVSYDGASVGVTVELGSVSGGHGSGDGFDSLISIESAVGSSFADTLIGDGGANALDGSAGNDHLTGSLGRDTLTGGAGSDMFDFNALAESGVGTGNRDTITDFRPGVDDIDLSTIDANTARGGDQSFSFGGTGEFRGKAGELRYQTFDQPGTANDITVVTGDVDGDRVADFEIEISGIVQLTKNDFLL